MIDIAHIEKPNNFGVFLDLLRIVTGALLAAGSVQYIQSQASAMRVLDQIKFDVIPATVLIPILTLVLLVGGILLIFGLLTRTACILQIPVFFLFFLGHELRSEVPGISYAVWFDIIMFVAVLFFTFRGSGDLSIDRYLRDKQDETINQAVYRSSNDTSE